MKKRLLKKAIVLLVFCFVILFRGSNIHADMQEIPLIKGNEIEKEEKESAGANAVIESETCYMKNIESEESTMESSDIIINNENTEENTRAEITEVKNEIIEKKQESDGNDTISTDIVGVIGLEGLAIKKISETTAFDTRSSCDGNHIWETVMVIQEGNCELEWIYEIQCTVCGATARAYIDASQHNFLNGKCTLCGMIEVAPIEELSKWEFYLSGDTILLYKYISDEKDVIVYGKYKVDDRLYSAKLMTGAFKEKCQNILTISVKYNVLTENCSLMFNDCKNLKSANLIGLDTSMVKDMKWMFTNCYSLEKLDLSEFDTSNVEDMSLMFCKCKNLIDLDISSFNTSKVKKMNWMFTECDKLKNLDLSNFDTSNVQDMSEMFSRCSKLENLNINNLNTLNVQNMKMMFSDCKSLSSINVENFDTSNVTDMSSMFFNCTSLKEIIIENFNTENVENMSRMFYDCSSLTQIDLSKLNISKVTDLHYIFSGCKNLSFINLKEIDTSKVTDMSGMFSGCISLEMLNLTGFKLTNTKNLTYMFGGCSNLSNIYVDLEYWDTSNSDTTNMFYQCGTQTVTKI